MFASEYVFSLRERQSVSLEKGFPKKYLSKLKTVVLYYNRNVNICPLN